MTDQNIANGKHYKQSTIEQWHVGQVIDPGLIALFYDLSPMRFTAMKKILIPGKRGNKTYEQDIEDAIGALKRDLELYKLTIVKPDSTITENINRLYNK